MKLVILLYLEDDEDCVDALLEELHVGRFSRMAVDGHGPGGQLGWYGESAPYRSRLVFTIVDEELAARLLGAVQACTGVQDPRHPIRAFQLDVEASAFCGCQA